ncbi:MAG: hypothetical protein ACRDL8_11970 [Solirubrobacteraceae bacterium]
MSRQLHADLRQLAEQSNESIPVLLQSFVRAAAIESERRARFVEATDPTAATEIALLTEDFSGD